jgi:hypothetical protein
MRSPCCVAVYPPPPRELLNAWTNLYELGMYIMVPEPISAEYFIRGNEYSNNNRRIVRRVVFYAIRVV